MRHRLVCPRRSRPIRGLAQCLTLALVAGLAAQPLAAQADPADDDPRRVPVAPVAELRAVAGLQDEPEFELGAGLSVRAGWYVRGAVALLGGARWQDSATVGTARVEAAIRFHLDPFFEAPGCRRGETDVRCRGIYAGVGLSQRFLGDGLGAQDPALLLIVGVEGRRSRAGVWALELGVGGGARLGVTWRGNRPDGYR